MQWLDVKLSIAYTVLGVEGILRVLAKRASPAVYATELDRVKVVLVYFWVVWAF